MQDFAASGADCTSWPQTRTVPEVGARKPVIIFMVVDLPAPLGPRKPSTSPRLTENETLSTARIGPNLLVRLRIAIISVMCKFLASGSTRNSLVLPGLAPRRPRMTVLPGDK